MKLKTNIFLTLALLNIANATPTDEALVKSKCSICHTMTRPQDISKLIAPPMMGVMKHVKMAYSDKDNAVAFIKDYVLNPSSKKALCKPQKIKRFGLMPSQKGVVTKEELEKIADYLYMNYPSKKFMKPIKKNQTDRKLNALKNSPFLMNIDALPHLTKILMHHWDKEALNLSKEQKEKLLVVRKETMTGVKKIKQALKPLQSEIMDLMYEGADLKLLQPKVDEVAKLKAQATMIHLKCLKDSIEVLTDKQMEYILPFWDA